MQHLDEGTIHAWLDGALAPDEARQAEAHAAGCAECAAAVAEARGLIAASSMIISRLDGVLVGEGEARMDASAPPPHDIAAARAAADARQRPAKRSWFAAPGFRAAAAVVFLAGGVAVVQNMTGHDELASVVNDASQAETAPIAAEVVAQDATAASTEQAAASPLPPPTVGPAPALPRPTQAVGGMTPNRRAAPQGTVGDMSGVLAGAQAAAGTDVTPTGAPPVNTGGGAAQASVARAGVAEIQRAELRQENDLSASARAAAPAPAPETPAAGSAAAIPAPAVPAPAEPPRVPTVTDGAAASREMRRLSDSIVRQREVLGQAEEAAAGKQRFSPPAGVRTRATPSAAASVAETAEGASRCYLLMLSPWSPEGTIPGAPATRIELSADTGTVGPSRGQRLVRPMPGAFAGSYDHAWYTEVSPSTLVLTWATGTEGIVMRLVRSGDALAGTARTFGAADSVERTSTVRGERVDCGQAR